MQASDKGSIFDRGRGCHLGNDSDSDDDDFILRMASPENLLQSSGALNPGDVGGQPLQMWAIAAGQLARRNTLSHARRFSGRSFTMFNDSVLGDEAEGGLAWEDVDAAEMIDVCRGSNPRAAQRRHKSDALALKAICTEDLCIP